MVALIPARAGSSRIPGKNTRLFAGQPLITHTIAAAKESGVFADLLVCTDDREALRIAYEAGVAVYARETVSGDQADIVWVREALKCHGRPEAFAILRPTSPFRTAATIRRAFKQFTLPDQTADSIRAVQAVTEHPGKMWALNMGCITPLLDYKRSDGVPWHSSPTQSLPAFYVQNACLEMSYTSNVETHGTIHGRKVAPFWTEGLEGFDLNTEDDWREAERLVASGEATAPALALAGVSSAPLT